MGQKVNPHGLRVGVIKDWDPAALSGRPNIGALPHCIFSVSSR